MRLKRIQMPLASRMTLAFGALILVMFLAVSIVVDRHLMHSSRRDVELRIASLARSLAAVSLPYLMAYDYVTLQQIADDCMREPGLTSVVILDKEGLVGGSSNHRERVGQRAEDGISLRGVAAIEPFMVEEQEPVGDHCLVRVEPVLDEGGDARWGTLRITVSLKPLQKTGEMIRADVLLFAALGFLLAFGVSHLIARRITRPLGLVLAGAENLARGEWDPGLRIRTGDEIETLADRFHQTAESLVRQRRELISARDELKELNATLEEKVRKRTAQLVESQEKYRLLVEASPDPLCLLQGGAFRFVNAAFLDTFGYTEEQVAAPGFSLEKVLHPDFVRAARESLLHVEASGEALDADWVGLGRGGRFLDFEVRGHRVDYQGQQGVELLWIDLTDKKRLMRQVVQNERLRGIGEMTAMIAHNFNNLLAVILGRTQLLHAKTDNAFVRRGLEIIRTSAIQGGEIVKRIQDYAGNATELSLREVNVGPVLRDVAVYLENLWRVTRAPGSGPVLVDLNVEEVPPIIGSETLLTDVFKHLLLNAAESMPTGGTLTVVVRGLSDSVLIRIEDRGCGMSKDVRRRAFDPFFSTKGVRTRGLGLSASYGIIQRHRGRIDLYPRDGGGTVAEIALPIPRASVTPGATNVDSRVVYLTEEQRAARSLLLDLRKRAQGADVSVDRGDLEGKATAGDAGDTQAGGDSKKVA